MIFTLIMDLTVASALLIISALLPDCYGIAGGKVLLSLVMVRIILTIHSSYK